MYKFLLGCESTLYKLRLSRAPTSTSLKQIFHSHRSRSYVCCNHIHIPLQSSNKQHKKIISSSPQQQTFFYVKQQPIIEISLNRNYSSSSSSALSTLDEAKIILRELQKTEKKSNRFSAFVDLSKISETLKNLSQINAHVDKNDVQTKQYTSSIEASDLAYSILQQLEIYLASSKKLEVGGEYFEYIYSAVLNCYAKSGGGRYSAEKAESIFLTVLDKLLEKEEIEVSDDKESKKKKKKKSTKEISIAYMLNPTLDAWANSCELDAGLKAQELLEKVKKFSDNSGFKVELYNIKIYSTISNAWASSGNPESTDHVMNILDEMISISTGGGKRNNARLSPDTTTMNIVLKAWALSTKGEAAALQAESILKKMESSMLLSAPSSSSGSFQYPSPDTTSYNIVLDAWSRSNSRHAQYKVEEIMTRMLQLYQDGFQQAKPNNISFTSSISTIARSTFSSGKSSPGHRAERLLHRMKEMYIQTGDIDLAPTVLTYGAVLDAWAKSSYRGNDSAEKAEKLLDQLIQEAQEQYERTTDNRGKSFWHIHVNTTCFNSVLSAWAKSGRADAGLKAQELLNRLESYASIYSSCPASERDKHFARNCIPDIISYTSVINAYANTGSAEKAEEILHRLEQKQSNRIRPDLHTYSSVIAAWAKSGEPDAGRRAEAIMKRMMSIDDPDLQPNIVTISSVIDAHAKSKEPGSAARAEAILDYLLEQHERDKGTSLRPNVYSYSSVITAWAKSGEPHAAKRAENILCRLENDSLIKPNVICFNSALNACARTGGSWRDKKEAYNLALDIVDRMERKVTPDSFTYNILLDVFGKLLSPRTHREIRTKKLEQVFLKCCQSGYLDDFGLNIFRRHSDPELFQRVVIDQIINGRPVLQHKNNKQFKMNLKVIDLPPQWSSNSSRSRRKPFHDKHK